MVSTTRLAALGLTLVLAAFGATACGGSKSSDTSAVRAAVNQQLSSTNGIRVGLNTHGLIVGVSSDVMGNFSDPVGTPLHNIKLDTIAIDKKTKATAKVTFQLAGGTPTCHGNVLILRTSPQAKWRLALLTVGSCD